MWNLRPWQQQRFVNAVRTFGLALSVIFVSACSSLQPVSVESAMRGHPPAGLDFGSLVEVRTLAGRKAKFRVTEMNAGGLGGNAGFFWYDDMQSLKLEQAGSDTNATAIILGVLGVAALIWIVGNADSVAICSPSPCPLPNPPSMD
jgi:hypothetical protein